MGSSGKKRTTMAKLNRESKLRDKRAEKEARKSARKLTAASNTTVPEPRGEGLDDTPIHTAEDTVFDNAARTPAALASERASAGPG